MNWKYDDERMNLIYLLLINYIRKSIYLLFNKYIVII